MDAGEWCGSCYHMLKPHEGTWKHASRDDWSDKPGGDGWSDCRCVAAGVRCQPESTRPRMYGKRRGRIAGRHPDMIISDEVAWAGLNSAMRTTTASVTAFTGAWGAAYTGLSNALEED